MNKCALYARVSTLEQSTDMQIRSLREYVQLRGFTVYKEYIDEGISGAKDSRPALNELMNEARKRKFNFVIVYRFDRFARSTKHLIMALEEFKTLGIEFVSYSENIDTSSPLGKAIFVIVSAISELERSIIRERVVSGLKNARAKGKRLGRPCVAYEPAEIVRLRASGSTLEAISKRVGISIAAISRILQNPQNTGSITG